MIYVTFFVIIFSINYCSGQQHPLVQSRNRGQAPEINNEVLISTDRLISTIEYKMANLYRSDLSAIRQQLEQSKNRFDNDFRSFRNEISELKKTVDKVQVDCLQNQIFSHGTETISTNNSNDKKLDNLQSSIVSLKTQINRIEKDVLIARKTIRALNTRVLPNYPMPLTKNNFYHDNEAACTASDINSESGVRKIKKNLFAYCEVKEDDGGNWIVIQNRYDGSINFQRSWKDYKEGFGNIAGEFWLGLEKIYELTSSKLHELLIEFEDTEGHKKHAKYSAFAISGEDNGYTLSVLGPHSGNAEDALSYHAGMKFSTYDVDNDDWQDGECAKSHQGGFWYNKCDQTNLNGVYTGETNSFNNIHWREGQSMVILKKVKMMIRPVD